MAIKMKNTGPKVTKLGNNNWQKVIFPSVRKKSSKTRHQYGMAL